MGIQSMNTETYNIAFIDPTVSPTYLVEKLHQYNVRVIGIFTLEEKDYLYYYPEVFDEVIQLKGITDTQVLTDLLRKLNADYFFYGSEATVLFADKLINLISPAFANDMATSMYRYDKFDMQEAMKKAHLPYVKQIRVNASLSDAQKAEMKTFDFPVIIKPIEGSGSRGLKICHSLEAVQEFLDSSCHPREGGDPSEIDSRLRGNDISYVIQEFLVGDEYLIDAVSLAGEHRVVSLQRYEKIIYNGYPIYRYAEILEAGNDFWKQCSDFALKVLDAVGLKNGFSHIEFFLTKKGFFLVEVNPRISGALGFMNKLAENALGSSQPACLMDMILKKPDVPPSKLLQEGRIVVLQNWHPKKIKNMNMDLLKTLSSYSDHVMLKSEGTFQDSPKNLLDSVAYVLLLNKNKDQLVADYNTLMEWEKDSALF